MVVRRYIDFLKLLIPTPLVSALFCNSMPTFCSFKKIFLFFYNIIYIAYADFKKMKVNYTSTCTNSYR